MPVLEQGAAVRREYLPGRSLATCAGCPTMRCSGRVHDQHGTSPLISVLGSAERLRGG
jgi:hypothetical protein